MYVRLPLRLRNVEDLLFERTIDISHEIVRHWWNRSGPLFAADIRRFGFSFASIDKHQRVRIEVELPLEPRFAPAQDVGTILLGRMPGLFERDPTPFEAPQADNADGDPAPGKLVPQVSQRDVRLPLQGTQDRSGMGLDPRRAAIAALQLMTRVPNKPGPRVPADSARCAHPETRSGLTTRCTVLNRCDYPPAKINRQRSGYAMSASLARMQLGSD